MIHDTLGIQLKNLAVWVHFENQFTRNNFRFVKNISEDTWQSLHVNKVYKLKYIACTNNINTVKHNLMVNYFLAISRFIGLIVSLKCIPLYSEKINKFLWILIQDLNEKLKKYIYLTTNQPFKKNHRKNTQHVKLTLWVYIQAFIVTMKRLKPHADI